MGVKPRSRTRDEEHDATRSDPTNMEEGGMENIHTQCEYVIHYSLGFYFLQHAPRVNLLATAQISFNVRFGLTAPCTHTEPYLGCDYV